MILFLSVFNEKIISDTIMFIEKIKTIITSSSTTILSVGSFSERIDMVYDILVNNGSGIKLTTSPQPLNYSTLKYDISDGFISSNDASLYFPKDGDGVKLTK